LRRLKFRLLEKAKMRHDARHYIARGQNHIMVQKTKSSPVRQQEIIDAARKLIVKYGSEHLTVRRIAKEVGFSEAAIYRHFRSKKEILFFLVDHIMYSLFDGIDKAIAGNNTSLDTIDQVLKSHLSAIEQKQGMSFLVVAEIISLGDKKLNKKVAEDINSYIGRLRSLLEKGMKSGLVRGDIDLDAAATLLFGMIQGLVNIWALNNYKFNLSDRYASLWNVFRESVTRQ
jgi:AcrR family transcriptional regulator